MEFCQPEKVGTLYNRLAKDRRRKADLCSVVHENNRSLNSDLTKLILVGERWIHREI